MQWLEERVFCSVLQAQSGAFSHGVTHDPTETWTGFPLLNPRFVNHVLRRDGDNQLRKSPSSFPARLCVGLGGAFLRVAPHTADSESANFKELSQGKKIALAHDHYFGRSIDLLPPRERLPPPVQLF